MTDDSRRKGTPGGPPDTDSPHTEPPHTEPPDTKHGPTSEGRAAPVARAGRGDVARRKLTAGLLGILLGGLGVHKFYLGLTRPGVVMLACTLAGYALFTLLDFILIGFVFLLLPAAVGVTGLVEGVWYLTRPDADFEREYLIGKKPWL